MIVIVMSLDTGAVIGYSCTPPKSRFMSTPMTGCLIDKTLRHSAIVAYVLFNKGDVCFLLDKLSELNGR